MQIHILAKFSKRNIYVYLENFNILFLIFKGYYIILCQPLASLMAQWVKNPPAMQETQERWVQSLGGKEAWRRKWQPTPVFLPGKSHGQRSLAGYSPGGFKELDTTERLSVSLSNAV